ncbi:MAG: glycosyltransferase family 1 protein [Spirochaetaceae bacterium]|nr:glycosyltransferase family 1 protein [Spirochaetaceae bacterium]
MIEITTVYQSYLDFFYKKYPEVQSYSYTQQLSALLNDFNAECDFLHKELNKMGIESNIYFFNCELLQKRWKNEFKNSDLFSILLKQLQEEKPDILLISDLPAFTEQQLKLLKSTLGKRTKFVAWHFTTVNSDFSTKSKYIDEFYTGSKYFVNLLKDHCKSVKLLYHAFSPLVLQKLENQKTSSNCLFCGSIFLSENIHLNRIDLFSSLINSDITFDFFGEVYGSLSPSSLKAKMKSLLKRRSAITKTRQKTEQLLKRIKQPSSYGIEYYQILKNHNICLNLHSPISGSGAGNMRMFEVTGVGSCLVTDYKSENIDLFKPDDEIIVYEDFEELIEKLSWLKNHPDDLKKISIAGQKRTLSTHTYKQKAEMLNYYLQNLLNKH